MPDEGLPLAVRELTPELWPAFRDLFDTSGPVGRCWCMFWRIGSSYDARPREENRDDFHRVVDEGPPPGLLAFDGETAVGWCQLTPRDSLPWLEGSGRYERVDSLPVWSVSCFYVRKGYRRQGVTDRLIEAAVRTAREAGAPALEAYPVEAELTSSSSFTGYASTFRRAGFETVARDGEPRPIMRHRLDG